MITTTHIATQLLKNKMEQSTYSTNMCKYATTYVFFTFMSLDIIIVHTKNCNVTLLIQIVLLAM